RAISTRRSSAATRRHSRATTRCSAGGSRDRSRARRSLPCSSRRPSTRTSATRPAAGRRRRSRRACTGSSRGSRRRRRSRATHTSPTRSGSPRPCATRSPRSRRGPWRAPRSATKSSTTTSTTREPSRGSSTASSRTGNGSGTSSGSDGITTLRAKRALDVAVSGSLVVLLAPVWAAVGGAVALDMLRVPRDRGPLFYREPRVSGGRTFGLLKFRTLRRDVLAVAAGHVRPYEADVANLTWAGRRVLKPMYLDELPPLVNILRGDMSLVGPRPWPDELVERQVARGVDYRLRVPAGWTGPSQVSKGQD